MTEKKYVLALDQGTTSCRTVLFDRQGKVVTFAQQEFTQRFPRPGWVEHDAAEIWNVQLQTMRQATQGIPAEAIAAIGIANQRETTVVWDRITGKPLYNAIVWQDRRTNDICDRLKASGLAATFQNKTGLLIDPYFSATKIRWLLDHVPEIRRKADAGDALFGTVDSWLIWNVTGGKEHITDYSNASRTMLFNIHTLQWDRDILDVLDIPPSMLPAVKPSSMVYGTTTILEDGCPIPVAGTAGDQQAALFGQTCYRQGMAKNTYGTGCFMLMHTGSKPVASEKGLLTTIAWGIGDNVEYALEGSVFTAGAAIQWLRDGLSIIRNAEETERMALSLEDTGGVYFVPAFTGMGTPYWNPNARGMITGLTRGTNKAQIIRAALEAIAYQSYDVLQVMQEEAGIPLHELRVDGGAAANQFLMQFQSDLLGVTVTRPEVQETTALGAAYLAGLAVGFWNDREEINRLWKADRTFMPSKDEVYRNGKISGWHTAVNYQN